MKDRMMREFENMWEVDDNGIFTQNTMMLENCGPKGEKLFQKY